MRIQILRQADYTVSAWAGGVTTQLAIWPPQAQYAARSFDWRVSSAVVGAEESVFTRLPDYARHLAILDGQLRLRHNGGGELTLHPFTPHVFDGADETRSCGTCTDFNLMLRKGVCCGRIRPIRTGAGQAACLQAGAEDCWEEQTAVIYCVRGGVTLTAAFADRLRRAALLRLRAAARFRRISGRLYAGGDLAGEKMTQEFLHSCKNELKNAKEAVTISSMGGDHDAAGTY